MAEDMKNRVLADVEAELVAQAGKVKDGQLAQVEVLETLISDTVSGVIVPTVKVGTDTMPKHLARVFNTALGALPSTLDTKGSEFKTVIDCAAAHKDAMDEWPTAIRNARDAVQKAGGKPHEIYKCFVNACREFKKIEAGQKLPAKVLTAACTSTSTRGAASADDAAKLQEVFKTLQPMVHGQEKGKAGKRKIEPAFTATGQEALRKALEKALLAVSAVVKLLPPNFAKMDLTKASPEDLIAYAAWKTEQAAAAKAASKSAAYRAARQKNGATAEAEAA